MKLSLYESEEGVVLNDIFSGLETNERKKLLTLALYMCDHEGTKVISIGRDDDDNYSALICWDQPFTITAVTPEELIKALSAVLLSYMSEAEEKRKLYERLLFDREDE